MSKYLFRFAEVLIVALALASCALASGPQEAPAGLEQLFQGSEHQDIPWKVNFSSPRLMFQQVYLVEARARIDPSALRRAGSTDVLHFALRVQLEKGKWATGGEYKDYKLPPGIRRENEIEYATAVYLRPGNYTLNLAVFDNATGKSSLTRDAIRVPKLDNDPFPELDAFLAPVEFPNGFPQQEVENERTDDGELFPVAQAGDPIPIATTHPAVVDIVLDMAKRPTQSALDSLDPFERPRFRRRPEIPRIPSKSAISNYELEIGRLLQVGDLLSRLAPSSGCVRISAVDVLRMKTILDRADKTNLDWGRFEEQIGKFDQDTIDVKVLTNRKGPAHFMRGYLDQLSAESSACGAGARHYIIVVSHHVPFPAKDDKLPEVDGERARFYYLQSQLGVAVSDDLGDLLKPVRPERLSFNSPRDFRKALARIVSDMKAGK
ncbi:MAG TPA: hypothetical protein VFU86_08415 [Terriglobales bacterium]|nr:hypothetical protein [Terriglobales bacterium]